MSDRKFRAVATTRFGGVRLIKRTKKGFAWKGSPKETSILMNAEEVKAAREWAKKKKAKTTTLVPVMRVKTTRRKTMKMKKLRLALLQAHAEFVASRSQVTAVSAMCSAVSQASANRPSSVTPKATA